MNTAIILLNVKRKLVNDVAEQLAGMQEISEVYSVTGQYDLICIVRVRDNDVLANLMTKCTQTTHTTRSPAGPEINCVTLRGVKWGGYIINFSLVYARGQRPEGSQTARCEMRSPPIMEINGPSRCEKTHAV